MHQFLSAEWIEAFGRSVAAAQELRGICGDRVLVIEQRVTDVPSNGSVIYHVRLSAGTAGVAGGAAPDATVRFTTSYETAAAIAAGRRSAQAAFMAGELRIGGSVDTLIEHQAALAGLGDVFAALRVETAF